MSYGAKGAPKGYSNPRGVIGNGGQRICQKCNSTAHWTYECAVAGGRATPAGTGYVQRPSRTQLLRQGIKAAVQPVAVAPTPREAFEAELKERAAMLEAELRAEAGLPQRGEAAASVPATEALKDGGAEEEEEGAAVVVKREAQDEAVVDVDEAVASTGEAAQIKTEEEEAVDGSAEAPLKAHRSERQPSQEAAVEPADDAAKSTEEGTALDRI
jgi:hypothetical protein